jgi:hypothetical protein
MEYVSLLAGQRFSDDPLCTHRALASLARLVNDHIAGEVVRAELAELAPDLLVLGGRDSLVRCAVLLRCLDTAAGLAPLPVNADRWRTAIEARAQGLRGGRRWDRVRVRFGELLHPTGLVVASAFRVLLGAAGSVAPQARDELLRAVLREAVHDAHLLAGGPTAPPRVVSARASATVVGAGPR